ncbi:MAG: four helix bundle protein [Gemmatimonadota bacterium]
MQILFDHERLEVYRLARQFARLVQRLLGEVGRGHSDSKDNLKRAAKSITRNIAEGAGKWRVADKIHFYHIARASATECAASLDELVDFGLVSDERIVAPKEILARVVAMLIAMIKSLEARESPTMAP